jgi:hypothetical protein
MMRKTCGGFVLSLAGFCLLGSSLFGWSAGSAMAQEIPAPLQIPAASPVIETDVPEAASAESIEVETPRVPVSERMAILKTADLESLKAAQNKCMLAAQELSAKGPVLRKQMSEAYEAAKSSPEAVAMQQQIDELEKKLEQTLENSPVVQEKVRALAQANDEMLEELQLRTTLMNWIAAKDVAPVQISE